MSLYSVILVFVNPPLSLSFPPLSLSQTHPALYSKVKDLSNFWELIPLLHTTFGHIEEELTAIDTTASSTERFLVESVGTYIRMTAHSMTEHKVSLWYNTVTQCMYYVPTENGPEVEAAALEFEKCSYVTNDPL